MTKPRDILGFNSRYLEYIKRFNPSARRHLADDKITTKEFLDTRGVKVPKLIAKYDKEGDLTADDIAALPPHVVIKPNNGARGQGIVILTEKTKDGFLSLDGELATFEEILAHVRNILSGAYSMSGDEDTALVEKRILTHERLAKVSYKGLPDIRIIVFNMVPVIAMIRIPTPESGGKANMDMGGIGAGLDMAKGEVTYLAQYNSIVHEIPGIGQIQGLTVPYWDKVLTLAAECQYLTGLGYLGVDIAIDKEGPLVLELNARPGLKIQIANLVPLKKRLKRVEGLKVTSPEHGVAIAKALFGRKLDKDIKQLSGKTVIGLKEYVTFHLYDDEVQLLARIDPLRQHSVIRQEKAKELMEEYSFLEEDDGVLDVKYQLVDRRERGEFHLEQFPEDTFYDLVLGKRELHGFLVDPFKYKKNEQPIELAEAVLKTSTPDIVKQWIRIDEILHRCEMQIAKQFKLFPINYETELAKFIKARGSYNPYFEYHRSPHAVDALVAQLEDLMINEEYPEGVLLARKREELLIRLEMFRCMGHHSEKFTDLSYTLFAHPNPATLAEAKKYAAEYNALKHHIEGKTRSSSSDLKRRIESYLKEHGLDTYKVVLRKSGASRISVGKSDRRTIYLVDSAEFVGDIEDGLIAHEIGTHVMRAENGRMQPYHLLSTGTAGYLETEEGLATYNQMRFMDPNSHKFYTPMLTYLKTATMLEHPFSAAIDLPEVHNFFRSDKKSDVHLANVFKKAFRTKRGIGDTSQPGGYAKDLVYYAGLLRVQAFVRDGGRIKDLYLGKISIDDLPLISQCISLEDPIYYPDFLTEHD